MSPILRSMRSQSVSRRDAGVVPSYSAHKCSHSPMPSPIGHVRVRVCWCRLRLVYNTENSFLFSGSAESKTTGFLSPPSLSFCFFSETVASDFCQNASKEASSITEAWISRFHDIQFDFPFSLLFKSRELCLLCAGIVDTKNLIE